MFSVGYFFLWATGAVMAVATGLLASTVEGNGLASIFGAALIPIALALFITSFCKATDLS